jgi:hypothetical protein
LLCGAGAGSADDAVAVVDGVVRITGPTPPKESRAAGAGRGIWPAPAGTPSNGRPPPDSPPPLFPVATERKLFNCCNSRRGPSKGVAAAAVEDNGDAGVQFADVEEGTAVPLPAAAPDVKAAVAADVSEAATSSLLLVLVAVVAAAAAAVEGGATDGCGGVTCGVLLRERWVGTPRSGLPAPFRPGVPCAAGMDGERARCRSRPVGIATAANNPRSSIQGRDAVRFQSEAQQAIGAH